MSEKPLNLDTSENQVIDLFVKSWRAKSSDECSYPFTEQNNWTGTAVMEFMLFTLREFKQRIKEACEFYLRYKNNPKSLIKEHPKYKEEMIKENSVTTCVSDGILFGELKLLEEEKEIIILRKYNEWLFKLAFRGVLER